MAELCEVCGRGYSEDEGHLTGERGDAACYRLGYEREKARAEGLEREAAASRACITFDPPSDPAQIVARLRLIVENHNKQCGDFVTQRNSAWRRAIELGKAKKAAESALAEERRRAQILEAAIRWALGESGGFRPRREQEGEGAYWWRIELRALASGNARSAPSPSAVRATEGKEGAEIRGAPVTAALFPSTTEPE